MAKGKYITDEDLKTRLNPKTYVAIFDDDRTNDPDAVNDDAVQQVIDSAEGEVDSYLVAINLMNVPALPMKQIDRLVKTASLDYAESFAFLRHPEYPRTFAENGKSMGLWKIAENRMMRIRKAIQELPDITAAGTLPANTGGFVGNANPEADDLDPPLRFFEDTGIF